MKRVRASGLDPGYIAESIHLAVLRQSVYLDPVLVYGVCQLIEDDPVIAFGLLVQEAIISANKGEEMVQLQV